VFDIDDVAEGLEVDEKDATSSTFGSVTSISSTVMFDPVSFSPSLMESNMAELLPEAASSNAPDTFERVPFCPTNSLTVTVTTYGTPPSSSFLR
jgi:hypothetical protein